MMLSSIILFIVGYWSYLGVFQQTVDMVDSCKHKFFPHLDFLHCLPQRYMAFSTTVDHADICGLFTTCLAYVVELPLVRIGEQYPPYPIQALLLALDAASSSRLEYYHPGPWNGVIPSGGCEAVAGVLGRRL
jgi:hypothetical protein